MHEVANYFKQSMDVCLKNVKAVVFVQLLDFLRSVFYLYLLTKFTGVSIEDNNSLELSNFDGSGSKIGVFFLIVLAALESFFTAFVRSMQTGVIILDNKDPFFIQNLLHFIKSNIIALTQLYFVLSIMYAISIISFAFLTIIIAVACLFSDFFVIFYKSPIFTSIYNSFQFVRHNIWFLFKFGALFIASLLLIQIFSFSKILILIIMLVIHIVARTALMLFFLKNTSR